MNVHAFSLERVKPSWPLAETYVIDRRGLAVDVSGEIWQLNEPTTPVALNWKVYEHLAPSTLNAFKRYFAWLITTHLPQTVKNSFSYIRTFVETQAFQEADRTSDVIPYLAFSEARAALGSEQQWRLHHVRQLYKWCVGQGFPQFSRDVSNRLDGVVIGGNRKGKAVRSRDPDEGPLDAQEVAAITSALRSARITNAMPLEEQAILWLALSTGSNGGQYAALREEDLTEEKNPEGGTTAFLISIPRHKKGDDHPRTQFRVRRLTAFAGTVIRDLIAQNQDRHPASSGNHAARPLFRAIRPRHEEDDPLAEWAWHLHREDINRLIKRAVKRLRVLSRSETPLYASTRRFRYTLATRLIQNGASAYEVADALDHSDLQNVQVYFDIHSDIVDHLDRTLAMALAPRAQAFAKIVEREEDADRGDKPGSRCYFGDRERDLFEPVGTCGNHSFCNVSSAPLACYTCHLFQPWMDGPHDLVLDALLRDRQKKDEMGLNPKMVAINDHVITEVAGVIDRISARRGEQLG